MTDVVTAVKSERIVAMLKAEEAKRGLTKTEMAALLGISASLWTRISKGQIELGAKPLRGIAQNFPEIFKQLPGQFWNL
jgi:transcriptional regulator with XRE-family HTH domain